MVTKTKLSLFVFVVVVLFVGTGLVGPRSAKAAKQDSEPLAIATAESSQEARPLAATTVNAPIMPGFPRTKLDTENSKLIVKWDNSTRSQCHAVYGASPEALDMRAEALENASRANTAVFALPLEADQVVVYFAIACRGERFDDDGVPFKFAVESAGVERSSEDVDLGNEALSAEQTGALPEGETNSSPPADGLAVAVAPGALLSDFQFVSGEPSDELEIATFLTERNSALLEAEIDLGEGLVLPAPAALALINEAYSVSPPVVLTFLEVEHQLLSNPEAAIPADLSTQVMELALTLSNSFYAHYNGQAEMLATALNGQEVTLTAPNAASFAVEANRAQRADSAAIFEAQGEPHAAFQTTFNRYFGDPLAGKLNASHPVEESTNTVSSQPAWYLPWEFNGVWIFTSGPHPYYSASSHNDELRWSGVDFQPQGYGGQGCPNTISQHWVAASAAGQLVENNDSIHWLKIDHDGDANASTGWQSVYGHVNNRTVSAHGTSIDRGQRLGNPSCEGGYATGAHLHFGLKYENLWQYANGKVVSGWTIHSGSSSRQGTMTKPGEATRVAGSSSADLRSDNQQVSSGCTPGANGVVLYEQTNYGTGGRCRTFTADDSDFNNDNFNDAARSVRFNGSFRGNHWEAILFEHSNYSGRASSILGYGTSNLGNFYIGAATTSSIQIYRDFDDRRNIGPNQSLNGSLQKRADLDLYYFQGSQGQRVVLTMDATSSGLDSFLYLYSPSGRYLGYNDDGGSGYNSRLEITLPESGQYKLYLRSYNRSSSGNYVVRVATGNSGPTSCPTGQYLAQYYNNQGLSGTPAFTRCEDRIDYNWGASGPGNGIGNDNFSVRWTGRKEFSSGSYRFSARADDGVRVYVDGTRIIDAWRDQGATVYESTRSLSSGTHEIKMEYYENGGGAVAQLGWQKLTTTTCNNQYKAEYWSNTGLSGSPALTRCEGWPISHDWGGGSPGSGVPNDNFSARWTGTAHIDQGTYRFIARADDGIRVWLDNQLIINAWRDQGPTTYTVNRTVSSGNHTIKIEYYERGGGAVAQFRWERVSTSSGNLALNRSAAAWSQESSTYSPRKANDGSNNTRWSSRISSTLGTQRWYVDLGSAQRVSRVRINWETAYAARYWVIWSNDAQTWYYSPNHTDFYRNSPGWADHSFPYITARYVGLNMLTRAPRMNNYSLFEFEAYAPSGRSNAEMVELSALPMNSILLGESILFEE